MKRLSYFIYVGALVLLAALVIVLCSLFNSMLDEDLPDGMPDTTGSALTQNPSPVLNGNVGIRYYDQLDDIGQKMYDELYAAAAKGEDKVTFTASNISDYTDRCEIVIKALSYDNPELFWLTNGYKSSTSDKLELTMSFYPFWDDVKDKDAKIKEIENAVNAVVREAAAYTTDYEKIKFVHDYLAENTEYDHEALAKTQKSKYDVKYDYIFTAYGCLVDGKAVCSGYAKAFQLIMHELGYDCMFVSGTAGISHAWNCLFVDGKGYLIDVTWDDPDDDLDGIKYGYFCVTTDTLSKTHTPDGDFALPVCDSDELNYFKYNGYFLEKYDFDALCAIADKQKEEPLVAIAFGSEAEYKNAKKDLFDNKKLFDVPAFSDMKTISHTTDDTLSIIYVVNR